MSNQVAIRVEGGFRYSWPLVENVVSNDLLEEKEEENGGKKHDK